jgi:hypothetical protein
MMRSRKKPRNLSCKKGYPKPKSPKDKDNGDVEEKPKMAKKTAKTNSS